MRLLPVGESLGRQQIEPEILKDSTVPADVKRFPEWTQLQQFLGRGADGNFRVFPHAGMTLQGKYRDVWDLANPSSYMLSNRIIDVLMLQTPWLSFG